ncbi:type II toxin-antitoxin system VapC family toxin [Sphingobium terrigena]|uniref:Type II toxin-antitoxin system VapC family toxin n=1 Tax=Sphingobium terrigena TaxID=2304063 RepID=A0A418YSR3_9SPHN|nr:type II toxin-antitoxin system VapC family toxin [Sphingobium terrigena]RJG54866.1 type II toxin-antitoxin system VapC family toxin [Sphingobium terrigena]
MRLLLDTHGLIWWWAQYRLILGTRAHALLSDPMNDIFVSAATGWEIATKYRSGRLELPVPIDGFEAAVANEGFVALDVTMAHAVRAGTYDAQHRDPFDRLLAAQAELEGLTLLTRDPAFVAFPCTTLWD